MLFYPVCKASLNCTVLLHLPSRILGFFQGLADCAKDIARNGPQGFFKVSYAVCTRTEIAASQGHASDNKGFPILHRDYNKYYKVFITPKEIAHTYCNS